MFSGVRPSSGAETHGAPVAFGQTDPLERAEVAAAEDGRTPLNKYTPWAIVCAPLRGSDPDRCPASRFRFGAGGSNFRKALVLEAGYLPELRLCAFASLR